MTDGALYYKRLDGTLVKVGGGGPAMTGGGWLRLDFIDAENSPPPGWGWRAGVPWRFVRPAVGQAIERTFEVDENNQWITILEDGLYDVSVAMSWWVTITWPSSATPGVARVGLYRQGMSEWEPGPSVVEWFRDRSAMHSVSQQWYLRKGDRVGAMIELSTDGGVGEVVTRGSFQIAKMVRTGPPGIQGPPGPPGELTLAQAEELFAPANIGEWQNLSMSVSQGQGGVPIALWWDAFSQRFCRIGNTVFVNAHVEVAAGSGGEAGQPVMVRLLNTPRFRPRHPQEFRVMGSGYIFRWPQAALTEEGVWLAVDADTIVLQTHAATTGSSGSTPNFPLGAGNRISLNLMYECEP